LGQQQQAMQNLLPASNLKVGGLGSAAHWRRSE
jgi:hypothetical protein